MLKGDEITDRGVPEKAGDEWNPEAGRINMGRLVCNSSQMREFIGVSSPSVTRQQCHLLKGTKGALPVNRGCVHLRSTISSFLFPCLSPLCCFRKLY